MKRFTSKTQKLGQIGEKIAGMFLVKRGFSIIETNYTKKIGEIDIVARKGSALYFIEVKSVSCGVLDDISRETLKILPEDQFHVKKYGKFTRTVELYLLEKQVSRETAWEIVLLTVYIDQNKRQGRVIPFWNIVF